MLLLMVTAMQQTKRQMPQENSAEGGGRSARHLGRRNVTCVCCCQDTWKRQRGKLQPSRNDHLGTQLTVDGTMRAAAENGPVPAELCAMDRHIRGRMHGELLRILTRKPIMSRHGTVMSPDSPYILHIVLGHDLESLLLVDCNRRSDFRWADPHVPQNWRLNQVPHRHIFSLPGS